MNFQVTPSSVGHKWTDVQMRWDSLSCKLFAESDTICGPLVNSLTHIIIKETKPEVWQVQSLVFSCVMFAESSNQYVVLTLYLYILCIVEEMWETST